jgi:glutamine phosphoribosylpyrophosphate amidotransferase
MAILNALAQEAQFVLTDKQITIDSVIPTLDTSCVTTLNLAQAHGLPYLEGFVKSRYVARTFITTKEVQCHVFFRLASEDALPHGFQERKVEPVYRPVTSLQYPSLANGQPLY